jgi:hypothetical protein
MNTKLLYPLGFLMIVGLVAEQILSQPALSQQKAKNIESTLVSYAPANFQKFPNFTPSVLLGDGEWFRTNFLKMAAFLIKYSKPNNWRIYHYG